MRLLDAALKHPLATAALAGVVAGMAVGLFLPIRAADPPASVDDGWRLPSPAEVKRYDENAYMALRTARFMDTTNKNDSRRAQTVQWQLIAIVTRPSVRVVVTSASSKGKPAWVIPGGKLPDGATLVGVDRDAVWYEKDGCRASRKLYAFGKAETEPACAGRPPAAPAPAATPTTGSTPSSPPTPEAKPSA